MRIVQTLGDTRSQGCFVTLSLPPKLRVTGDHTSTKLTDISIRKLKPGPVRREIPDAGARGLYLIMQPSGHRNFAIRYRSPLDGKPKKLTLKGGVSLGLAHARREAANLMYQLEQGIDPGAAKNAWRAAAKNTFRAVAEEYMRREGSKLRTVG